jgi:predicted O-methyltransferase YrrM
MNTWLDHYRINYYPLLNIRFEGARGILADGMYNRAVGFDIIWRLLLNQQLDSYSIIETGTLRTPNNWMDGQSAALFTAFVDTYSGQVRSVDIDPEACAVSRAAIGSDRFSVACSDSVDWLQTLTDLNQVNLFYLDSWDVNWDNDTESAEHHLKEFRVIESHIQPGTVVVIDDNSRWAANNQRTGKGRKVVEYLEAQGRYPVYDEYQIIFQF